MILKNLATNATVTLPDSLLWRDEHTWPAAVSSTTYLLNGALLIQSAAKQAGRQITLQADADMAWVRRSDVDTLRAWAAEPITATTGRFLLTFADARSFTVAFRHDERGLEAEPVLGLPATGPNDWYRVTLKFMEIPA
jgi:hypothetical protein